MHAIQWWRQKQSKWGQQTLRIGEEGRKLNKWTKSTGSNLEVEIAMKALQLMWFVYLTQQQFKVTRQTSRCWFSWRVDDKHDARRSIWSPTPHRTVRRVDGFTWMLMRQVSTICSSHWSITYPSHRLLFVYCVRWRPWHQRCETKTFK